MGTEDSYAVCVCERGEPLTDLQQAGREIATLTTLSSYSYLHEIQ